MAQTVNFSNTTPAPGVNGINVLWQNDASNPPNISAYMASGVGGVSNIVAKSILTVQSAAIPATTIFSIPSTGAGFYRISYAATVTRAATTQSILGGTTGFQIQFTNGNGDTLVKASNPTNTENSNANSIGSSPAGSSISGVVCGYCGASTNIQYLFDYMSAGGTTMQYDLAIFVEYLGA